MPSPLPNKSSGLPGLSSRASSTQGIPPRAPPSRAPNPQTSAAGTSTPGGPTPPNLAETIRLLPWHLGKIAVYRWPAQAPTRARGVVLLVHGLGEHMGRYAHVAHHLQREGWICVGYDHPGHGRSDGIRGRLPQEWALVQALIHVALHVINELPSRVAQELPFVLIGHSMGGLVVAESLRSSTDKLPDIAAVVLSAPAFGAPVPSWQKLALRAVAGVVPHLGLDHAIQPQWVCRDTSVVRKYVCDPLVHRRISPRLGHWILDRGARVVADAGKWQHPCLILSAGTERLVSNQAINTFLERAPSGTVDHHHEPAMFHEMFNDAEHQRVLQAVSRWLEARAPLPLA